ITFLIYSLHAIIRLYLLCFYLWIGYDRRMKYRHMFLQMTQYWWQRLLVSDPGMARFFRALKVTVTVIASVLTMILFVHFWGEGQVFVPIFAGVLSLISTLVISFIQVS